MNDPHVESIRYRLEEVDEKYGRFENPPPIDHETEAYRMRLEEGVLTVEMKEHHPTIEFARRRVENDLKAWELDAALSWDHAWLRFVFDHGGTKIVDRNPDPSVPEHMRAVQASGTLSITVAGTCNARVVFNKYPRPPRAFEASLEVEVLVERYQKAIQDESQLLFVGYLCLSFLEGTTGLTGWQGARNEVVRKYRIARPVLKTLGDLVSEKGDIREARKLDAGATLVPLSQQEKQWLRAAMKSLIRRKAEYDHDPDAAASLPEITMDDLPEL